MKEYKKLALKSARLLIGFNIALIVIYVPLIIINAILYKYFDINFYLCAIAAGICAIVAILSAKDLYKNLTMYSVIKELPEEEVKELMK